MNLFDKDTYQALLQKKKKIESTTLKEFFRLDKKREENFSLERDGLLFDFSKNLLDLEVLQIFEKQSHAIQLQEYYCKNVCGRKNQPYSENNSVLHTALRKILQQKNTIL